MNERLKEIFARLGTACRAHVASKRGFFDGDKTRELLDAEDAQVCEDIRELREYIASQERRLAALEASAVGEPYDEEASMEPVDVLAAREGVDVVELLDEDDDATGRRARRHQLDVDATIKNRKARCLPCERARREAANEEDAS